MKKVDASDKNVRIPAENDSQQNELRGKLYNAAFGRIDKGLTEERYFEVISLADSIITDRVQALTQDIIRNESEQYGWMSVGAAIEVLFREVKTRNIRLDKTLKKNLSEVHGVWTQKRNIAAHGFVVVTPKNLEVGVEERLENVKVAAEEGAKLARLITDEIDKFRRDFSG
jgi:hypothetical protein